MVYSDVINILRNLVISDNITYTSSNYMCTMTDEMWLQTHCKGIIYKKLDKGQA